MDLPAFIPPMLASSGDYFSSTEYQYEPKWDGIRCLAFYDKSLQLMSRNANDITKRFPELSELTDQVSGKHWVLDGELIVLDAKGKPSFDLVRNRNLLADPSRQAHWAQVHPATLIAFDLLYYQGRSLLAAPLTTRRSVLQEVVQTGPRLQISPVRVGATQEFHATTRALGFEGTVIKELNSPYIPGQRTKHWIKVRHVAQTDCVIGGYTVNGPATFGSLLLGQYARDGAFTFVGHVGTGFSQAENVALATTLRKITQPAPPFATLPRDAARTATWVRPLLVCTVEYLTWTSDGLLRHPVYRGYRTDKAATECVLEPDHPSLRSVRPVGGFS